MSHYQDTLKVYQFVRSLNFEIQSLNEISLKFNVLGHDCI